MVYLEPPTRFIVLPYVSHKAEGFAKRLKTHVAGHYPQVDFNVAFKAPNEVGKFFPFKDKIDEVTKRANVVYRIRCKKEGCEASYIGMTTRRLAQRLQEHRTDAKSACNQHEKLNEGHTMDLDEVEVLDSADSLRKLQAKELLHILDQKLSLNKQLNEQSNFNIKTLVIAAYPQYVDEADTP